MPSRRAVSALAAVLALALAAPAGAQAAAQTAACPGADVEPTAANLPVVAQATLCLLNDERAGAGLPPVAEVPGLTQPSAAYSARMVAERFFAHVAPDGSSLVDRLTAAGYIAADGDWAVGENIAWGQGELATARNIVIAWMNSHGHRENILTREYDEIGIGIVPGTPSDPSWGATYTTDFGAVTRDEAASQAVAGVAVSNPTRKPAGRKAAKTCKTTTARARAARTTSAKGKRAKKSAKVKRAATCVAAAKPRTARARKAARSSR